MVQCRRIFIFTFFFLLFSFVAPTSVLANSKKGCLNQVIGKMLGWKNDDLLMRFRRISESAGIQLGQTTGKVVQAIKKSTETPFKPSLLKSESENYAEVKTPDAIVDLVESGNLKYRQEFREALREDISLPWMVLWKYRQFKAKLIRRESQRAPSALILDGTLNVLNSLVIKARAGSDDLKQEFDKIDEWIKIYSNREIENIKSINEGFGALFDLIQVLRAKEIAEKNEKLGAIFEISNKKYVLKTEEEIQNELKQNPTLTRDKIDPIKSTIRIPGELQLVSYSIESLKSDANRYLGEAQYYLGPIEVIVKEGVPIITTKSGKWYKGPALLEKEVSIAHLYEKLNRAHIRLTELSHELSSKIKQSGNSKNQKTLDLITAEIQKIEKAVVDRPVPSDQANLELGRQYFESELDAWENKYNNFSAGMRDLLLNNILGKTGGARTLLEELAKAVPLFKTLLSMRHAETKFLAFLLVTMGRSLPSDFLNLFKHKPSAEEICAQESDFEKFKECVFRMLKERHPESIPLMVDDGKSLGVEFEDEFLAFTAAWEKAQSARKLEEDIQKRTLKAVGLAINDQLAPIAREEALKEESKKNEAILSAIASIPDEDTHLLVLNAYLLQKHKTPLYRFKELWAKMHDSTRPQEEKAQASEEFKTESTPLLAEIKKVNEFRNKMLKSGQLISQNLTSETSEEALKREAQELNDLLQYLFRDTKPAATVPQTPAAGSGQSPPAVAPVPITTPPLSPDRKGN